MLFNCFKLFGLIFPQQPPIDPLSEFYTPKISIKPDGYKNLNSSSMRIVRNNK
jgi:hypothetical protein